MTKPKLILLYGFAGTGKTTLANRYIATRPLAMNLEGDRLIVTMGQWLQHEDQARRLVFSLSKVMTEAHLQSGHDVILPWLLTNPSHAIEFEALARQLKVTFIEIFLAVDKNQAIKRLLKRGSWGEEGTDPLTGADMPTIEQLHDDMMKALKTRPHTKLLKVTEDKHDDTYNALMRIVDTTTLLNLGV